MAVTTIKIIDTGKEKYHLCPDDHILGRRYDNKADFIKVIKPDEEKDSLCEMFVKYGDDLIDVVQITDKEIEITTNLSQYLNISIGFSFSREDGYVKNSEYVLFDFLDAIKPEDFTPEEPQGREKLNFLLAKGFTDVKWKDGGHNTLQFMNVNDEVAKEIGLSGFVQEQGDLAETDGAKETFIKNKSTRYLLNEGENGFSKYATEEYVANNAPKIKNIVDAENRSLKANDISSNRLITDGYMSDGNIITTIDPMIISYGTDYINDGYYAIPSSYFEIDGRGHYLYEISGISQPTTLEELLPNIDNYGRLITKHYKANSKNMNVFGEDNTNLGSNSIVNGSGNISSGNDNVVSGYYNVVDSSDSLVAGSKNISTNGCNVVVGARNSVNEKQSFASGYNNKILSGSYFSDSMGVGNINKGTATSSRGGYNLAGSEYSSVEGIDNIAGGDATFNGKHLADIDFYSDTTQYGVGALVKRNGFVFKAIKSSKSIIPNPTTNLDYWEIVQPLITTRYAKACKASGEKCVAKHTGAFTHGYRLTSGRDYQTVLGKNNVENSSALLVVGAGSSDTSKLNALEVNQTETNINGRVNIKGGNTTGVLRQTTGGELVVSGVNGIRLRPTSTTSNRGGIAIKDGYIAPEMTSSLGTLDNAFSYAYIDEGVFVSGENIENIFGGQIYASIDPKTYVLKIDLKTRHSSLISTTNVDLPLETMVIGATYSDGKLHLTLKNGNKLDVDISDIVSGLVPDTRTINGKALSTDITLTASDVNAYTKTEIDSMVGDINTALESILGV